MDVNPYESPKVPEPQQYLPASNDGKHCPACGGDIGIWPIMWAMIPGRCRCPYCRAELTWNGAYLALAVMVALTLVVMGGAFLAILMLEFRDDTIPIRALAIYVALTVPPVAFICWAGAVYQRRNSILKRRI